LWLDPRVDGLKTGHTERAGFCLIATANHPVPGEPGAQRRLLSVIMGEPTEEGRVADSMKLLTYGYSAFDTVRVFQGKQTLMTQRIYKGTADQVNLGVKQDYFVTLPRTAANPKTRIKTTFTLNQPLIAPVQAGQQLGTAKIITDDGSQSFSVPLIALKAVPQAGLASRLWDSALLYFVKK
jgi:D-alanyl-D-alanine carboxypeptidase (penicillin-binding protein 5/6)